MKAVVTEAEAEPSILARAEPAAAPEPPPHAVPVEVELRPLRAPNPAAAAVRVQTRRRRDNLVLFGATFVLPALIASLYLFVIAAPRYASDASFIVRSAAADAPQAGMSSLMASHGVSRAVDETYAINEYISSPDVIAKLVANDHLLDILNRPEADVFNRYPGPLGRNNQSALRRRFNQMVTQTVDEGSGISRIEVVAFRPEDAQAIAGVILAYAEGMVNRLNERAYEDALKTSNRFVDQAMESLRGAEGALNTFRDTSGTVDPNADAAATMKVIQTLTTQLSRAEVASAQQEAMAPDSPQRAAMRQQIEATRAEIDRLNQKVVGASTSTASKLGKFEELMLRRTVAAKGLDSATMSRDKAREDAEKQHLYVQVIREPILPDAPLYPRAWLDLAGVAGVSLVVFLAARGLLGAMMEHRA